MSTLTRVKGNSLGPANTVVYQYTSEIASNSHVAVTGLVIRTNYYDSNVTAGSGATFKFTGVTTLGKAGNVPDADGYFYDAVGRQFEVLGDLYPEKFGARGDGVALDHLAVSYMFAYAPDESVVHFKSGSTYLWGAKVSVQNNRSYTLNCYGAKFRLDEGAGNNFMKFTKATTDPDDYSDDYIIVLGGTWDANGRQQQFKNAAFLRDGNGVIAAPENTATGQAYRDATATVFGSRIWATATNEAPTDTVMFSVQRYGRFTVRDAYSFDRVEDGFEGFDCQVTSFINCTDRDGINTNDQFVITYCLGGVDTGGHQHFAWKGSQANSWGILDVVLSGTISVGNTVTGAASGATGIVYRVDGTKYYLKNVKAARFVTGENLQVSAVTQGTCNYFDLRARGVTNIIDCDAEDGNTAGGYVGISNDAPGSGLTVRGGRAVNQGTAGYRNEGGEYLIVDGPIITSVGVACDKTKTLLYGSIQAINISNSVKYVDLNLPYVLNLRTSFEQSIDIVHATVQGYFECDDTDPLLLTDGSTIAKIGAFVDGSVYLHDSKAVGVKTTGGDYVVTYLLNGSGARAENIEFDTIDTVFHAVRQIRNVRGQNCNEVADDMYVSSSSDVNISDIEVDTVGSYAFEARGFAANGHGFFADKIRLRDVQGSAFKCADANVLHFELTNSFFDNIGLNAALTAAERAVIGGTGSCDIKTVIIKNNTFRRTNASALAVVWNVSSTNDITYDIGSVEMDTAWTRVGQGDLQSWLRPGGLDGNTARQTIAAGVITMNQRLNFMTLFTEAGAASDDLDTVTFAGAAIGDMITLTAADSAKTVVCKNGTGNLQLASDFSLTHREDTITLIWRGASVGGWFEVSRSDNAA